MASADWAAYLARHAGDEDEDEDDAVSEDEGGEGRARGGDWAAGGAQAGSGAAAAEGYGGDYRAAAQDAKARGDLTAAVANMEQVLVAAVSMEAEGRPMDDDAVSSACEELTSCYNALAMRHVDEPEYAFELLRKADIITAPAGRLASRPATRLRLRAITLNNLGCYYKRRGKLHAALHCLERALKIEASAPSVENPAGTHLNVCAVLSQLGRHAEALRHAGGAVRILEEQVAAAESASAEVEPAMASVLAIALHNRAVEREFLGMLGAARDDYEDARALAERAVGAESPTAQMLQQALGDFKRKERRLIARGGARPRPSSATRVAAPASATARPASARRTFYGGGASAAPAPARPRSAGAQAAASIGPASTAPRRKPFLRPETARAYARRPTGTEVPTKQAVAWQS